MEIEYGTVIFPDLDDNMKFDGVFSISSDTLQAWVKYDKGISECRDLISFIAGKESFTVQLTSTDDYAITGFDCICLTPFINTLYESTETSRYVVEPIGKAEQIEIRCKLWITGFQISSIHAEIWRSICIDVQFSECWFDCQSRKFKITDAAKDKELEIVFSNGISEITSLYPKSYLRKQNCKIYIFSEYALSTKEAIIHINSIQALLRYMSDISYPINEVKGSEENNPKTYYSKINGLYGLKGISERPSAVEYANIPLPLSCLDENSLSKWISSWRNISTALVKFDLARGKPLTPRIIEYVKVFDSLSSHFKIGISSLQQDNFKEWKKRILEKIKEDNPFDFSQDRIGSVLDNLNRLELRSRISSFLELNIDKIKKIRNREDISEIARYLKKIRNSDAHPSDFDLFKLPKGYSVLDISEIAKQLVRTLIDKEIFSKETEQK